MGRGILLSQKPKKANFIESYCTGLCFIRKFEISWTGIHGQKHSKWQFNQSTHQTRWLSAKLKYPVSTQVLELQFLNFWWTCSNNFLWFHNVWTFEHSIQKNTVWKFKVILILEFSLVFGIFPNKEAQGGKYAKISPLKPPSNAITKSFGHPRGQHIQKLYTNS